MTTITDYLQNDPLHYDFTDDCTDSTEYKKGKKYIASKPRYKEVKVGVFTWN